MERYIKISILCLLSSLNSLANYVQSSAKEIKVDIYAEVHREISITNTSGKEITGLTFYHGRWTRGNLDQQGGKGDMKETLLVKNIPTGKVTVTLEAEERSRGLLVREGHSINFSDGGEWDRPLKDRHDLVLPHAYKITFGLDGGPLTEITAQGVYYNVGHKTIGKTVDVVNNSNSDFVINVQSDFLGDSEYNNVKVPGRYYNRSTLYVKVGAN